MQLIFELSEVRVCVAVNIVCHHCIWQKCHMVGLNVVLHVWLTALQTTHFYEGNFLNYSAALIDHLNGDCTEFLPTVTFYEVSLGSGEIHLMI